MCSNSWKLEHKSINCTMVWNDRHCKMSPLIAPPFKGSKTKLCECLIKRSLQSLKSCCTKWNRIISPPHEVSFTFVRLLCYVLFKDFNCAWVLKYDMEIPVTTQRNSTISQDLISKSHHMWCVPHLFLLLHASFLGFYYTHSKKHGGKK